MKLKHQMLGYDFVQQQLSNEYAKMSVKGFILAAVRRNCLSQNHKVLNTFAFKSIGRNLFKIWAFPFRSGFSLQSFAGGRQKDFRCNP
jgi:hypothetical protein